MSNNYMSNNSVRTVTCDSTGKVVYPTNFNVTSMDAEHITNDTMSVKSNIDLNYYRDKEEASSTLKAKGWYIGYLQPSKVTIAKDEIDPDTLQKVNAETTITYVDLTLGTIQRKSEDLAKKETVGSGYHLDIADLPIQVGDVFLLVTDAHIPNALVVVKRADPGDGTITCRWLPNYDFKLNPATDDTFWNYSVYICGEVEVNTIGKIKNLTVTNNSDRATLGVVDLTPVAFNIGANNFVGGYAGVTVGDDNEVYDAYSMTVGLGNQIVGYSNFTAGRNSNVINGEYSIACGHSTSVKGNGSVQKLLKPNKTAGSDKEDDYDIFKSGTGCAVFGRINSSNNDYGTLISGIRNSSYSSLCGVIFGRENKNNGHYSIIAGTKNKITKGESNAVFGNDNTITGSRCFALGQGLKGYNNQTVIGKYNKDNTDGDKAFIIGQGSSDSNRKNIFEVTKDGTVNVANRVFISNTTNGSTGGDLLIGASELKNLGDYQSSFTKNKIEIAKAYDYKYDENYEQTNEIGKEYVKLTHNSLTLEAEAPGGYNQDKVELNREGLVFTKQEGTQTCVLNPREIRLYNSNYDMFEVNSNGGSDPYHIKLATAYNNSIGDGELEITPTSIKITEVTEKHDYNTVMESRTINISYLKDLETRLERVEKLLEEQLIK